MRAKPERATRSTFPAYVFANAPLNVYWETTLACDLACRHCRADARPHRDPRELSTDEAKRMLDDVRAMGSMIVLTGGDPMKREDLFELIAYGREIGVPVAVTPSTTPTLTREHVLRFRSAGVAAMGMSLDGPTAELHDGFRGVAGTFDRAMAALDWAQEAGLGVQVNTTVTADTLPHVPALYRLLCARASKTVRRWILFMLVPTGRAAGEEGVSRGLPLPTPDDVESLFSWVYETAPSAPFHLGTIEAPQYRRYFLQRKMSEGATTEALEHVARSMGFGVRDGNGVVFVNHVGDVFPAGFLPWPRLGNVRDATLSSLYAESEWMRELRNSDALHGKCGACDYRWVCGGSRARAFAMTGDAMGSDPLCAYRPPQWKGDDAPDRIARTLPVLGS